MNVLICIGCNEYDTPDTLPILKGAEADARRVFDALMASASIYDKARSALLLSPTLSDVLTTIRDKLFGDPAAQTFTIFFAGHACVAQGSLHLALKDTRTDRLSMTALGMARVFDMIAEARPRVANIVLDACQAAGSHYDLHALLKPDILGKAGGSSVVFLGACMADQYASEDDSGGRATVSLLRHLTGEVRLQDSRATLDLVELGQAVSEAVTSASSGAQSPACWAVALAGYGAFSANPHYRPGGAHPAYTVDSISPASAAGRAVSLHSEELWEEHRRLTSEWSPTRTHELLCSVVSQSGSSIADLTCFLRGVSRSLRLRASHAEDLLAESDVCALVGLQLLPHLGSVEARTLARELLYEWTALARSTASRLTAALRENRFALLEGGLGEFHHLPMRVSKLFGWLGALALVEEALSLPPSAVVQEAAGEVSRHYARSAVAVSEAQGAALYLMVAGLMNRCPPDLIKELTARYVGSAVMSGGFVLSIDAPAEDVVAYTAIRSGMPVRIDPKSIAQPTECLSVLLQAAHALGLSDLDMAMHAFDRRWLNSFVPTDYADFGQPTIAKGMNIHQQIGFGAWTLADIEERVGAKVRGGAQSASSHLPAEGRALCVLAAHLLEDRVPYLIPLPGAVGRPAPAGSGDGAPGGI